MRRFVTVNLMLVALTLAACGDDPQGLPTGSEGGPCYPDGTCDGEVDFTMACVE